jgi:hypothetical protein
MRYTERRSEQDVEDPDHSMPRYLDERVLTVVALMLAAALMIAAVVLSGCTIASEPDLGRERARSFGATDAPSRSAALEPVMADAPRPV